MGLAASITAKGRLQLGLFSPGRTTPGDVAPYAGSGQVEPTGAVESSSIPSVLSWDSLPPISSSLEAETAVSVTDSEDGYQVVLLIHRDKNRG